MSRKLDSKQSQAQALADEDATGEEEAQESQRRCQVCHDVPSSIICLTCSHTIDIPCAARVIIESAGENQPDITSVECQECGVVTDLSEEVQAAILAFISRGLEEEYGEEEQNGNEEGEENNYQEEMGEEENDLEEEQQHEQMPATSSEPKSEYRAIHGSMNSHGASKAKHSEQNRDSQPTKQPNSSNGFGRGTPQTESNRPTPKRSNSELKESVSQAADLSLRFVCLEHPSDEYAYYSPLRRKLYCAQCILVNDITNKVKDLKPLKRCLPLILQHFSEMLNEVKVSRNLLSNRKRDLEIRLEDLAAKLEGIKNSEIIRIEDLFERLEAGKKQFLENFDQKVGTLLSEVADHSDNLDEKLDFLENVELKIQELQQPDSEEDLIGFYFANQEVIRDFLQEQSEQKLMARLRTNCESAELKAKAFCDTEMLKLHHSMTKDLADLFKDVSKGFSLKEDIIKFETEFVHSRGLGHQHFLARTPKPTEHPSVPQHRAVGPQNPSGGVRGSHNFERLSGSDSKVPYRNTWGRQGSDGGDGEQVKGYDAARLSRPASGKTPTRESPFLQQPNLFSQGQPAVIDRRTHEAPQFGREKRAMTPTLSSAGGRHNLQAATTPQPLLKALENPFLDIEKKLAVFDIKNPSNHMRLIKGGPLQSSGAAFSNSLLRHTPLLGLRGLRGGLADEQRPFSGKPEQPPAARIESIDSLRCFRQKVRDRFQTSQNSRAFVPLF